jgi:uncharacterized protein YyaL (SSP411 family)
MTAVQMMTRHGGWPMSVFLLPDGRPFYGGTYFPPGDRGGRPGFPTVLRELARAYRERPNDLEEFAAQLTAELQQATRQSALGVRCRAGGAVSPNVLLARAVAELEQRFDEAYGGFGPAPKFPPHHALRLLIETIRRTGGNSDGSQTAAATRMLAGTLDNMARGGVYDHVGGGFHRYSTDRVWLLPHFEKMLYDNALLARVYADAFRVTGNEAHARVAAKRATGCCAT